MSDDEEEEAEEGDDDDIQVIPDSEPPAEPTMRQRVDATKSCEFPCNATHLQTKPLQMS